MVEEGSFVAAKVENGITRRRKKQSGVAPYGGSKLLTKEDISEIFSPELDWIFNGNVDENTEKMKAEIVASRERTERAKAVVQRQGGVRSCRW